MKILIADDDPVSRRCLEAHLLRWGHRVVVACDGPSAWEEMQAPDWMMPGLDCPEVCRRVRSLPEADQVYVSLLTSRSSKKDVVAGLESGANDYIVKPFDRDELRARLQAGVRIVELQQILADRILELGAALSRVKQLQGLLPICCYCKKIRDDHNYWRQVESYIEAHSEIQFSHSICPGCLEAVVKPELEKHYVHSRSAPGPV
jgi:CheY-like chemotaxis protein